MTRGRNNRDGPWDGQSLLQTRDTYGLLVMLVDLLQQHRALLVLAAFVLEPDADHSRTQSSHLDELFLHQSVWSRVGAVAGAQRVKLFLVQHRPYPRRLLVGTLMRPRPTAVFGRRGCRRPTAAVATVLTGRLTCCTVGLCNKIR